MTTYTEDECSKRNQVLETIQKQTLDFQNILDKLKALILNANSLSFSVKSLHISQLDNQQECRKESDCGVLYGTCEDECEDETEDGELDYESNCDEGKMYRILDS